MREVNISLPFLSIVFFGVDKIKFHPTALFESVISCNIVLFETAEHIFTNK